MRSTTSRPSARRRARELAMQGLYQVRLARSPAADVRMQLVESSAWAKADEAYFDEGELTEREGKRYAPSGAPVEWVEEESYFFKLSAYQDRLLALYESQPDFIFPEKYKNEIVAFVKRGLTDLSVSRTTFDWGIPVPGNPKHVMYVWVDALTNYITATGFPDLADPRRRYWPADAHVIGKDITRFHAIYWPAFLMSADQPLPKQVVVHGFLFNRGEKMSKSVGNVISPKTLADHYGVDQLRYFFLREVPFGQDGNYSHEAIVQRMPPPKGDADAPLQALIFDSWYDNYRGVVTLVRVKEGTIRAGRTPRSATPSLTRRSPRRSRCRASRSSSPWSSPASSRRTTRATWTCARPWRSCT
jgi:hypothetical protein